MRIMWLLACASVLLADGPGVILSRHAKKDVAPTADPQSKFWKGVPFVIAENGPRGEKHTNTRTEIRSRWTADNLYVLFVSPYESMYLKPNPVTDKDTVGLWDYDVVEVFVGSDFQNINLYKEFEVSPQEEWIDLDVDHGKRGRGQVDWKWNSNFVTKARIDRDKKIWYCEMRIPLEKIDKRPAKAGNELRINFYRIEGGPKIRKYIAWQPTGSPSYHVPEAFGRLRMVK